MRVSKFIKLPIVVGKAPDNIRFCNSKYLRFVKLPMLVGILPFGVDRTKLVIRSVSRFDRFPIVVGSPPVKELSPKSNVFKLDRFPNSFGIDPVNGISLK